MQFKISPNSSCRFFSHSATLFGVGFVPSSARRSFNAACASSDASSANYAKISVLGRMSETFLLTFVLLSASRSALPCKKGKEECSTHLSRQLLAELQFFHSFRSICSILQAYTFRHTYCKPLSFSPQLPTSFELFSDFNRKFLDDDSCVFILSFYTV